ncbi:MAG: hypothetical protein IH624_01615, partial [Phycisphaerae bacterium]|nr:hypothetical protein [Phycisphaerae bacterium]
MRGARFFAVACVAGAIAPFWVCGGSADVREDADFPGWPTEWQGRALRPVEMSAREKQFGESLPVRVGLFTDGRRQYIIRWIVRPTRRVHPSGDCFRASGYRVRHLGVRVDGEGQSWSAIEAVKGGARLIVRERIYDGQGRSFCDVSAWYWAASMGRTEGPWWAVSVVERVG